MITLLSNIGIVSKKYSSPSKTLQIQHYFTKNEIKMSPTAMILAFLLENIFIQAFYSVGLKMLHGIPIKITIMIGVLTCPMYFDISFSLTIGT